MKVLILLLIALLASCSTTAGGETQSLGRGNEALEEKKYDEAIALYDEGLREDGRNAKLRYNKAVALALSGREEEAILLSRESFSLLPHHLRFLTLCATCQERLGRTEEAIATYRQILSLNPGDDETRRNLMESAYEAGKEEEAREQALWFIRYNVLTDKAWEILAKIDGEDSAAASLSAYLKAHPPR